MNQEQIDRIFIAGITAAKKGENDRAQELLLAVIEVDEANEQAWLWLSGVVDSDKDRQICLENVLLINPDNAAAKRGLERLGYAEGPARELSVPKPEPVKNDQEILISTRFNTDHSTETQDQQDQISNIPGVSFQSELAFDDVWERNSDICEYCAAEIGDRDRRCPNCGQKIFSSHYRYAQASSDLTIYWVLLLGVAQLSLILIMLNLLLRQSLLATAWQGLMLIVLIILVVGVFFRQFWGYIASLAFLIFAVATIILDLVIGPTVNDVVGQAIESGFFQSLSDRPYIYILGPLEDLLVPLQSLAVILALFFGIFRVGPDFERVKVRQIARVDRGLDDATQLYAAGIEYARQKKWANAILQYQKAVALAPTQFYYQRALGQAYAQLGYYQRSLDVLESAHRMTVTPDLKLELEQVITQVEHKLATSNCVEIGLNRKRASSNYGE